MSEELKPCPFCGSSAKPTMNFDGTADYSWCRCSNPDCPAELDYEFMIDEIWQTRPIEDDLRKRIAELEAERERVFDLVRELRTYCIFANWDNPDTEDDFNEFDVEVCKWLSKYMEREE